MSQFIFTPPVQASLPIAGTGQRFPVRRIYCVGRNYADHALEMGSDPREEPPFFFTKPADAVVCDGKPARYPPRTSNLHHEIELVVAIGKAGADIAVADAWEHVFGFAVGLDLTRRDLQNAAKKTGRPWDTGKAFDESAPVSEVHPLAATGAIESGRIWLNVNGELRQQGDISDLIWSIPEVIAELSSLFVLKEGDLIFTGTPAGVAAISKGDVLEGGVDGVGTLRTEIA